MDWLVQIGSSAKKAGGGRGLWAFAAPPQEGGHAPGWAVRYESPKCALSDQPTTPEPYGLIRPCPMSNMMVGLVGRLGSRWGLNPSRPIASMDPPPE